MTTELTKKSVVFTEDVIFTIPCRDESCDRRVKGPSETIYDCVRSMRNLVDHMIKHFMKFPLSQKNRLEVIEEYLEPVVNKLVDHEEIQTLVIIVKHPEIETDGSISVHQVLYDFIKTIICNFRDKKSVSFMEDGYIESRPQINGELHMSIGTFVPGNLENCICLDFDRDAISRPISYKAGY